MPAAGDWRLNLREEVMPNTGALAADNAKPEEKVTQPPCEPPPREEKPRRTERGFSDYPLEEKKQVTDGADH